MTIVDPEERTAPVQRFSFDLGFRLSLILEPDGRVRAVTEASGIGGPPPEAFIGHSIVDISTQREGGPERGQMWVERLVLAGATSAAAHYADPPPGMSIDTPATVDCTVTPIRTADGTLDSILMVVEDRTTYLETQTRLADSVERFRMLAEALPQMVWSVDETGRVDYFSPRWAAFTGRSPDELLGNGYLDLIHPDDLAVLDADRHRDLRDRPTVFRLRRHDGEYRWMEAYSHQFRDGSGRVIRGVGGTTDITARREAEERAHEHEEQLRGALAMTRLGRFTVDISRQTLSGDARVAEVIGSAATRLMSGSAGLGSGLQGLFELIHPDDSRRVRDTWATAIGGGADLTTEYRILRPNEDGDDERIVAVVGRVEFDDDGPQRVHGVIEDITDRRAEEEARLIGQKREAIGTLAGGVAHDFNNVIGAILSNASLAQKEIDAGVSPSTSVTEIARAAVRAAELVRRMLAYSREDQPVRGPVDLASVVREVCSLLRPTMPPAADLRQTIEPALPSVLADANQLHQIAMNLVTNARQALGERAGTIEVLLDQTPSEPGIARPRSVRLRVRDDGPGMSEAVMARAFDPFFTTKPVGQGTGLGLSTVQTIIRDHGGTVCVSSEEGAGTTFTLTFPAATDDDGPPETTEPPAEALPRASARVLFVDDQRALVTLAERAMPAYGCKTTGFTEPRHAIEAFVASPHDYDVLVTDLSMPEIDGLDLARQLRAVRPDLPIVLTSGYLSSANRQAASDQGIDAVVPKPSTMDDLVSTILGLVEIAAA